MAWPDKLKLNKQLIKRLTASGFDRPEEIQSKTLARISGGQDLVVISPEGTGKTTTCLISALNKFRMGFDDAPRVLLLVPDKEHVVLAMEQLELLNKNKSIRTVGLYAAPGLEAQLDALADGADIVIATPDRARAIYLKLALNLNKIQLLILDDADLIIKQGLQLPVAELANSITKCQHLVFTEVMHDKLQGMIAPFMKEPATITYQQAGSPQLVAFEQLLYHVPNFRTKLNLLNLFMEDSDLFTKVIVIVNSIATADKICGQFKRPVQKEAVLLGQFSDSVDTTATVAEFMESSARILVAISDSVTAGDTAGIPILVHFDLPEVKETYIARIEDHDPENRREKITIAFAADLELGLVSKIEQATGIKMPAQPLPEALKIETNAPARSKKPPVDEPLTGAAFHEKKPANAKTTNYSSGTKAKMNKKRKHG